MKKRGAWLAVVASLAAVLACGSGNNGSNNSGNGAGSGSGSGGFPYTGPSCGSGSINEGCWGCLESSCNGSCLTNACNDFFNCFCNCAQGDSSCYQGCAASLTPGGACDQCVQGISSCATSSCSSACGSSTGVGPPGSGSSGSSGGSGSGSSSGGGMFQSCGGSGQVCAGGVSEEFCETGIGSMCTSAYYQVGSQVFSCASCSDTAECQKEADAACGPTIIDAGPPDLGPPDEGPFPDAPFGDAGNVTCTPHPCGTMGQSMTFCESFDANDACTAAWYQVANQIYDCNSCADCTTAAQEASKACP